MPAEARSIGESLDQSLSPLGTKLERDAPGMTQAIRWFGMRPGLGTGSARPYLNSSY